MKKENKVYKSIVFKHKIGRNVDDSVSLFIEKIEAIFLFKKTLLTAFIVDLAFAYS